MSAKQPSAVYIHIPFCAKMCHYCDFNTYVAAGQPIDAYLRALAQEMRQTAASHPLGVIQSVFVGGGTPTILSESQMEYFLNSIQSSFELDPEQTEFTMEANPGTTDPAKLHVMRQGGVNRLSFGAQTFHEPLLHSLGRTHGVDDVYESIRFAQEAGFRNISIDLMFGLPGQNIEMMEDTLQKAIALNLAHYSVYGLIVEENTLFHHLKMKQQLLLPPEEEEYAMFELIRSRMKQAGYRHYEISNFAKSGSESVHNIIYWRNEPYLGIGAGAHGYTHNVRHMNIRGVQAYIDAVEAGDLPRKEQFEVTREEAMEDFMMVGLRMTDGVTNIDFKKQFGVPLTEVFGSVLHHLVKRDLLEETFAGYRLTEQGLLFGNDVFAEFIGALTSSTGGE